tara:strand:+ start:40 stop:450 length:411 start_codon:yes stop_codon:yes gene_type:complete
MAITYPAYKPTIAASVLTDDSPAGGETEAASAIRFQHTIATDDVIVSGALVGLSLQITSWSSGTETVTVRVYRASDLTDLILEVDVAFTSANDKAYVQPGLPIPFFAGIWVTIQSDTGAQETCNIKPDILGIAGNY